MFPNWNPFKKYPMNSIIIEEQAPASHDDDAIKVQIETARLKSLLERTRITSIHERLAEEAVSALRGAS